MICWALQKNVVNLKLYWQHFKDLTLHFEDEEVSANLCQCQNSFVAAARSKTMLLIQSWNRCNSENYEKKILNIQNE